VTLTNEPEMFLNTQCIDKSFTPHQSRHFASMGKYGETLGLLTIKKNFNS